MGLWGYSESWSLARRQVHLGQRLQVSVWMVEKAPLGVANMLG